MPLKVLNILTRNSGATSPSNEPMTMAHTTFGNSPILRFFIFCCAYFFINFLPWLMTTPFALLPACMPEAV